MKEIIPILSVPKIALSAYVGWKAFGYLVFAPLSAGYVHFCNSKSRTCDYEYFPSMDFFTILGFQCVIALVVLLALVAFCLWGTKWQKYASLLWFGFLGIVLASIAYVLVLLGIVIYRQFAS